LDALIDIDDFNHTKGFQNPRDFTEQGLELRRREKDKHESKVDKVERVIWKRQGGEKIVLVEMSIVGFDGCWKSRHQVDPVEF
jgi:hypothetical protein